MKKLIEGIPTIEIGKWYYLRAKTDREWQVEGAVKYMALGKVLGITHEGNVILKEVSAKNYFSDVRVYSINRSDVMAECQEHERPGFVYKLVLLIAIGLLVICGAAWVGVHLNKLIGA